MEIKKKYYRPRAILPEIVDPKERHWSVSEEENAKINFDDQTMEVPYDHTEFALGTRAHEMGHIRWTPDDLHIHEGEVPHILMNAVEDGRINKHLRAIDIAPPYWPDHASYNSELVDVLMRDPLRAAAIRAAIEGTGAESIIDQKLEHLHPKEASWIKEQAERLTGTASPDVTVDVAKKLWRRYAMGRSKAQGERLLQQYTGAPWKLVPGKGKGPPQPTDGIPYDLDLGGVSEVQLSEETLEDMRSRASMWDGTPASRWCQMEVQTPNRPVRLIHGRGRGHRGEYYGRVPRYPHRMATDLRIFANRLGSVSFPGSVLIDLSGSMGMSANDVDEIVRLYPSAEIRAYASDGGRNGWLRVIAKAGRRVNEDQLSFVGQGNGVDGPALQWLAKAPRPRFWISDAMVTGIDDSPAGNLLRECLEIIEHNRIIKFGSIDSFRARFGGLT